MNLNKGISIPIAISIIVVAVLIGGFLYRQQWSKVEYVSFSKIISNPQKYDNKVITTEGFYIGAFETSVLSPTIKFSEGGLPQSRDPNRIWIDDLRQDISERLYSVKSMSQKVIYGKIRITGRFNTGGGFGHISGYKYLLSDIRKIKVLSWSPPEEAIPKEEAVNWETYTNQEYGFKLKYPSEVDKSEISYKEDVKTDFEDKPTRLFQLKFPYTFDEPPFQSEPFDLNLESITHPVCFSHFFVIAVSASEYSSLSDLKEEYSKSEYIVVDGTKALRRNEFVGLRPGGGGKQDVVYIPRGPNLYMIHYIVDKELLGNEENATKCLSQQGEIFDKVISGFEFID